MGQPRCFFATSPSGMNPLASPQNTAGCPTPVNVIGVRQWGQLPREDGWRAFPNQGLKRP